MRTIRSQEEQIRAAAEGVRLALAECSGLRDAADDGALAAVAMLLLRGVGSVGQSTLAVEAREAAAALAQALRAEDEQREEIAARIATAGPWRPTFTARNDR